MIAKLRVPIIVILLLAGGATAYWRLSVGENAADGQIRVSGNINLAALQVLNAANIQVQGEAAGIPVVAAVNTGALTSASSAASAVANQAANLAERTRPQVRSDVPTIVTVTFAGFGE